MIDGRGVAREARDMRERRDPEFEVLKTSDFGPRTVNSRSRPSSQSHSAILWSRVLLSQTWAIKVLAFQHSCFATC
jgi:hypothetical protein